MTEGTLALLARGGPWTQLLFFGAPLWALLLIALIVLQRRRLELQYVQALAATPEDADVETVVGRIRASLGPLSGGAVGTTAILAWWGLALAALLWSTTRTFDVARLADDGFLAALTADGSVAAVVGRHSSALITRAMVGITAVPLAIVTVLALDQALLRPRGRWLDEVRRRVGLLRDDDAGARATLARVNARTRARWSWSAYAFRWLWLAGRGLPKHAAVVLLLEVALSAVVAAVMAAAGGFMTAGDALAAGQEPTAGALVWRPLAWAGPGVLLGAIIASVVAARAPGWDLGRKLARGDTGPDTTAAVTTRYRHPLFGVALASVIVLALLGSRWREIPDRHHPPTPSEPTTAAATDTTVAPRLLEYSKPEFPEEARRRGLAGEVLVKILVDVDGTVRQAEILRGVDPLLDEAALKAAYASRWSPGRQGGTAVRTWMALPYVFTLE